MYIYTYDANYRWIGGFGLRGGGGGVKGKGKHMICQGKGERLAGKKGKGKGTMMTFEVHSHPTTTTRAATNETKRFPGWTKAPNLRFTR